MEDTSTGNINDPEFVNELKDFTVKAFNHMSDNMKDVAPISLMQKEIFDFYGYNRISFIASKMLDYTNVDKEFIPIYVTMVNMMYNMTDSDREQVGAILNYVNLNKADLMKEAIEKFSASLEHSVKVRGEKMTPAIKDFIHKMVGEVITKFNTKNGTKENEKA